MPNPGFTDDDLQVTSCYALLIRDVTTSAPRRSCRDVFVQLISTRLIDTRARRQRLPTTYPGARHPKRHCDVCVRPTELATCQTHIAVSIRASAFVPNDADALDRIVRRTSIAQQLRHRKRDSTDAPRGPHLNPRTLCEYCYTYLVKRC